MENRFSDITYIVSLAHLKGMRIYNKNTLLFYLHDKKIGIDEFFNYDSQTLSNDFSLRDKQIDSLEKCKEDLPKVALVIENLKQKGIEIINILSSDNYPRRLFENLRYKHSPTIIYTYGNKDLFNEPSIAVVGSRNASDISLDFTDMICKKAATKMQVVVSGFAKGVDRKSLDSILEANGKAIIVLPQGILTAESTLKKYYQQINDGDILIFSTFYPSAPWSVQFAMARNIYIYGLGEKIIVAESGLKGGTWNGVIDGLKKNREIYVRKPNSREENGNQKLIDRGAKEINYESN